MSTAQVCSPPHCCSLPKADPPKVNPEPKHHAKFSHTTHSFLKVCDDAPGSPQPEKIDVTVFDPSKNIRIPFTLKSTDTTDMLNEKYLQMRPELVGTLNLAYNGKPVPGQKTLRELGVKPGAVFITFQRCVGG
ncbi:hypothetical protein PHYPO_G00163670 [Pangasianodon hypophthalmus]|uniref:Ubiquitin-like domain-containing protein n=1 Tax=Pangasianodon hypophthalmus TaxID=310915 RepID=A0A5N5JGF1_PANHP|nr:uncharacterized protein LOC117596368 [Pangasianodon hypophthalmus]KAB5518259.1 hypothetical protein PHYPO_G00163670 [Pangasianodon hypophthalmus]